MKEVTILFFLSLITIFSLNAQSASKLKFSIFTGTTIPISSYNFDNFSDGSTPGISFGVGVGYQFTPHSLFQIQYNYNRFWFEKTQYSNIERQNGVDVFTNFNLKRTMALKGLYKLMLIPDRLAVPYITAGVGAVQLMDRRGAFMVNQNEMVSSEVTSLYWEALFSFGGGFKFKLHSNLNLILEAQFDIIASKYDPVQFTPIKIGIEF